MVLLWFLDNKLISFFYIWFKSCIIINLKTWVNIRFFSIKKFIIKYQFKSKTFSNNIRHHRKIKVRSQSDCNKIFKIFLKYFRIKNNYNSNNNNNKVNWARIGWSIYLTTVNPLFQEKITTILTNKIKKWKKSSENSSSEMLCIGKYLRLLKKILSNINIFWILIYFR